MVGVGLLCGLLIVTIHELTGPVIARNQAAALEAAVFEVLPAPWSAGRTCSSRRRDFSRSRTAQPRARRGSMPATTPAAALVGVAIEGRGMGYQDTIRLLYGYAPAQQAIVGMRVLESKETPGLGDKIEKDPDFAANFERLSAALNANGDGLANPIVAVKRGAKTQDWQIDGITGATISSVAVARILSSAPPSGRRASRRECATSRRRPDGRPTEPAGSGLRR